MKLNYPNFNLEALNSKNNFQGNPGGENPSGEDELNFKEPMLWKLLFGFGL